MSLFFIARRAGFGSYGDAVKGRWLVLLFGLVMWAHHVLAAVQYELVNKQRVAGDKVVGVTAQGIRFGSGFNPGPLISWTSLTTNSVLQISTRLSHENVFIQKSLAEKNAIATAIRGRLNQWPVPVVSGGPVAPAVKPGGPVAAPGIQAKGMPLAPVDELFERPPLEQLTPEKWRGIPDGFVPLGNPDIGQQTLIISFFSNPILIFFYLLILGANFYLAREVADCRRRPRKLVCGLAFLVPFIVPLVFMLLPVPEGKGAPSAVRSRVAEAAAQPAPEPEPQAAPVSVKPQPQPVFSNYYHRDRVKFNRKFFTAELMRFNRAVPIGEWLVVRTNNDREYWASRIVKAEEEVITFSVAVGEIWSEQAVRYYQINEIFIQPVEG